MVSANGVEDSLKLRSANRSAAARRATGRSALAGAAPRGLPPAHARVPGRDADVPLPAERVLGAHEPRPEQLTLRRRSPGRTPCRLPGSCHCDTSRAASGHQKLSPTNISHLPEKKSRPRPCRAAAWCCNEGPGAGAASQGNAVGQRPGRDAALRQPVRTPG
jgi:hypothetical protein